MKQTNIKKIVLTSILSACIFVVTFLIAIPIPATKGYINFGDSIILISSLILGPLFGGLSGGIGSCIADFILAPQWALFTFVIKFCEGFLVGLLFKALKNNRFSRIISLATGVTIMISGYFIAASILYDVKIAIVELLNNLLQGGVSLVMAVLVSEILVKYNYIKEL